MLKTTQFEKKVCVMINFCVREQPPKGHVFAPHFLRPVTMKHAGNKEMNEPTLLAGVLLYSYQCYNDI